MTDVLDRAPIARSSVGERAPAAEGAPRRALDLGGSPRWLLAAPLIGAGVIHLAMAPSHLGESALEGAGFLVAGWLQLALALALVTRPRRWVVGAAAASSVALIVTWLVSRIAGLPFGAHSGHAESVSIVDGVTVAFEVVVVVAAALVLAGSGRPWMRRDGAMRFVAPVAVIALTTAALASPAARDHASGSHGDHGAAGHAHDEDDLGLSLLTNGHDHGESDEVALDATTQAELDAQLAVTAELVASYPTVAAAEAAGYTRQGPFSPGLGAHYSNGAFALGGSDRMSRERLLSPFLIFDGMQPDSRLAGFMYLSLGADEPEGFVGPNDHWHYHTQVCIVANAEGGVDTPFGADLPDVTEDMCTAAGGSFIAFTGYMVHVWTVPGYESERGTFSDINPAITCPDGTYFQIPIEELGTGDTMCRSS